MSRKSPINPSMGPLVSHSSAFPTVSSSSQMLEGLCHGLFQCWSATEASEAAGGRFRETQGVGEIYAASNCTCVFAAWGTEDI